MRFVSSPLIVRDVAGMRSYGHRVILRPHIAHANKNRKAAVKEFNSALVAYKRRQLMETLSASSSIEADSGDADDAAQSPDEADSEDEPQVAAVDGVVDSLGSQRAEEGNSAGGGFRAAGALMFPGLDRGRTLWEEDGYQSSLLLKTVPVPLGGFFVNGVAGVFLPLVMYRAVYDMGTVSVRLLVACYTCRGIIFR